MSRARLGVLSVGLLLLQASFLAQEKPDFSGRWVVLAPADGAGSEQRVTHDRRANTLTLGA
jgi:hypothetical protein